MLKYFIDHSGDVIPLNTLEMHLAGKVDYVRRRAYWLASHGYLDYMDYKKFPAFILMPKGERVFWSLWKRMMYWFLENWLLIISTLAAIIAAVTGIIGLVIS